MKHYYAIHVGKKKGIFKSWAETLPNVKGFSGAMYKRFSILEEALYFVEHGEDMQRKYLPKKQSVSNFSFLGKSSLKIETKKGEGKCNDYLTKFREFDETKDLILYSDGSAINNGKKNAYGGYGVFFSDKDIRPISEKIEGKVTNNIGELKAIIEGLKKVKELNIKDRLIRILTDSQYSCLAITQKYQKYQKNNWQITYMGKKKDVANKKLIIEAHTLLKETGATISHIYACHENPKTKNELGNYLADRLANRKVDLSIF